MESLCCAAAQGGDATDHADNRRCRPKQPQAHGPKEALPKLMLGAIGVVYGDIGTSPLYTMKESFLGPHPLAVDPLHIFGVLCLIFWTLMLIVTFKYVLRRDARRQSAARAARSRCCR